MPPLRGPAVQIKTDDDVCVISSPADDAPRRRRALVDALVLLAFMTMSALPFVLGLRDTMRRPSHGFGDFAALALACVFAVGFGGFAGYLLVRTITRFFERPRVIITPEWITIIGTEKLLPGPQRIHTSSAVHFSARAPLGAGTDRADHVHLLELVLDDGARIPAAIDVSCSPEECAEASTEALREISMTARSSYR